MTFSQLLGQTSPLRLLYHRMMGCVAALRYGFPGRKLRLIGITGTDGKTSTCYFTAHILERAGYKVGLATTVGFQIGDKKWRNTTHKTTLGRFGLQRLLSDMVKAKVDVAVIEVSSHGLMQSRLTGLRFQTAFITNLSREHLDYHGTMEAYRDAKGRLFRKLVPTGTSIVCSDFDDASFYLQIPAQRHWSYGAEARIGQHLQIDHITTQPDGYNVACSWEGKQFKGIIPLVGVFQVHNALGAALAAHSVGVPIEAAIAHCSSLLPVPGRMEPLLSPKGVRVIVDYAVTPKALEAMYTSLAELKGTGRLIGVLGACGDRDQGKRPEMGRLATTHCDEVIFTNEEPYTEDPASILAMLTSGAVGGAYQVIPDRQRAIAAALAAARAGDIVVVSGMGDQTSMIVGHDKHAWSDREVITSLFHQ